MNPFNVGDVVRTMPTMATQRHSMVVEYTACVGATTKGGKTCSYKTCGHHTTNDYCWVRDANTGALYSYIYGELMLDPAFGAAAQMPGTPQATAAYNPPGKAIADTDLDVPSLKDTKATDVIVDAFQKSVKKLIVDRSNDPIPNDKVDWEAYSGHKKTKNGSYRLP